MRFSQPIFLCCIALTPFLFAKETGVPKGSVLNRLLKRSPDGKLPYPFSEIARQLKYMDEFPFGVAIPGTKGPELKPGTVDYISKPGGRSLQRKHVTRNKPRILLTVGVPNASNKICPFPCIDPDRETKTMGPPHGMIRDENLINGDLEGKLFFGFSEIRNAVEIISWNEDEHEFDFLEVEGYGTDEEKIVVPDRSVCLNCHRLYDDDELVVGGPAFSRGGWSEIDNQHPNFNELETTVESKPKKFIGFHGILTVDRKKQGPDPSANRFDQLVHTGNRYRQAVHICKDICENNIECRKHLLFAALFNPNPSDYIRKFVGSVRVPKVDTNYLERMSAPTRFDKFFREFGLRGKWPEHGFAYLSHVFPDPTEVGKPDPRDKSKLLLAKEELNPRRIRKMSDGISLTHRVAYLWEVAFDCLGFTKSDHLLLKNLARDRDYQTNVTKWLTEPAFQTLLRYNRPRVSKEVISFIKKKYGQYDKPILSPSTFVKHTKKYCQKCHAPTEERRPAFTEIFDEKTVTGYFSHDLLGKERRTKFLKELNKKTMPRGWKENFPKKPVSEMIQFLVQLDPNTLQFPLNNSIYQHTNHSYIVGNPNTIIIREQKEKTNSVEYVVGFDFHGNKYISPDNFPNFFPGVFSDVTLAFDPISRKDFVTAHLRESILPDRNRIYTLSTTTTSEGIQPRVTPAVLQAKSQLYPKQYRIIPKKWKPSLIPKLDYIVSAVGNQKLKRLPLEGD